MMETPVRPNTMMDENHSPPAIVLELSMFSRFFNPENSDSGNGTMNDSNRQIPTIEQSQSKPPKKKKFLSNIHFIVCCIGYSIGLGNIWRFPSLAIVHGGGSFLITYLLMTIFVGAPLVFLELALGQYTGKSPVMLFLNICPIFCGLGPAMLVVTALVMIYYNVLLAWILIYIYSSFSQVLPWETCDQSWSSQGCFSLKQYLECMNQNKTLLNGSCHHKDELCSVLGYAFHNVSHCFGPTNDSIPNALNFYHLPTNRITSSANFYTNYILDMSHGIEDIDYIRWQLVLALLVAWFLVFVCLIRGSYTSGRLVYFTALFPWVLLIIMLIKNVMLEGALTGIIYYITPEYHRLLNADIWGDAAVQVLFSLGTSFGMLISLSNDNALKNNFFCDAVVVVICDSLASFVAGAATFSVIGSMAFHLDISFEDVNPSSLELIFITISEAATSFAISPFWSFLFFAMLLTVGLDNQHMAVASLHTAIEDALPSLKSFHIQVLGALCLIGFGLGLPMTTDAGVYIFKMLDKFTTSWSLLIIAILQCVVVIWLYGSYSESPGGFVKHIEDMLGCQISKFWTFCWKYVVPIGLSVLLITQWLTEKPLRFSNYTYPKWAYAVGWVVSFSSVLIIPIVAVCCVIINHRRNKNIRTLLTPTEDWIQLEKPLKEEHNEKLFYNHLAVHKLGCYRKH